MIKIFDAIEEKFLILNLFISTIMVFMNVVLRYVFHSSPHWVDEAARYMFLWLIWVGADFALKERKHLRIDMLVDIFSEKTKYVIELLVLTLWLAFCIFLGYQGVKLVGIVVEQRQLSTSMQINMGWAYASVPCGAIFMSVRLLLEIKRLLTAGKPGEVQ